jgi:hypothetical protein
VTATPVRTVAGLSVLVLLGAAAILLAPPYLRNMEYSGALQELVAEAGSETWPDDRFRVAAVNRAQRLGISVRPGDVRIRRDAGVALEVRYLVPIDFMVYTVNLHMRARSGS